jgi:hypothetical protein
MDWNIPTTCTIKTKILRLKTDDFKVALKGGVAYDGDSPAAYNFFGGRIDF